MEASLSATHRYEKTDLVALLSNAQNHINELERVGALQTIRESIPRRLDRNESWVVRYSAGGDCDDDGDQETLDALRAVSQHIVKVQAPMVRCSRPPFRKLCRLYGTDINYTHMIMADSFVNSEHFRMSDFQRYAGESRLVTQLGVKNGNVAARVVSEHLFPHCDAFDINCGCPQSWARQEGIGSILLESPEAVRDIVYRASNSVPGSRVDVAVKMRVFAPSSVAVAPTPRKRDRSDAPATDPHASRDQLIRETVDFSRQMEAAGAAWLTVHGRTPKCTASAPVNFELIKLIKENVSVPVVANGGVNDWIGAVDVATQCTVGSVMSGRGLLNCPAAFYSPFTQAEVRSSSARAPANGTHQEDPDPFALYYKRSPTTSQDASGSESEYAPFHFLPQNQSSYSWRYRLKAPEDGKTQLEQQQMESDSTVQLWTLPHCPIEVISDFIRIAAACDLPFKATHQHLLQMADSYLSPQERVYITQTRSCLSLTEALIDCGLYTENGLYPPEAYSRSVPNSLDATPQHQQAV